MTKACILERSNSKRGEEGGRPPGQVPRAQVPLILVKAVFNRFDRAHLLVSTLGNKLPRGPHGVLAAPGSRVSLTENYEQAFVCLSRFPLHEIGEEICQQKFSRFSANSF